MSTICGQKKPLPDDVQEVETKQTGLLRCRVLGKIQCPNLTRKHISDAQRSCTEAFLVTSLPCVKARVSITHSRTSGYVIACPEPFSPSQGSKQWKKNPHEFLCTCRFVNHRSRPQVHDDVAPISPHQPLSAFDEGESTCFHVSINLSITHHSCLPPMELIGQRHMGSCCGGGRNQAAFV